MAGGLKAAGALSIGLLGLGAWLINSQVYPIRQLLRGK